MPSILLRCPYCREDKSIVSMSARTIPGYKNPLTGLSTATVEKLSCGHEYVDGKFNVDSLYYSNPTPPPPQEEKTKGTNMSSPEETAPKLSEHHHGLQISLKRTRLNSMDILCGFSAIFLALTVPVLTVIPVVYFIVRLTQ